MLVVEPEIVAGPEMEPLEPLEPQEAVFAGFMYGEFEAALNERIAALYELDPDWDIVRASPEQDEDLIDSLGLPLGMVIAPFKVEASILCD